MRDPLGNTTAFTYDFGDLVAVTDPLGNPTRRFLDGGGRLVSQTDPLGRVTRYEYDALNRLTRVTDPTNGATGFTYDGNGNLLTVTDTRGSVTSYGYNNMDHLVSRTDPLLRAESYTYDANGNLSQFTDRKGQLTTLSYDALNRRTQASYADASTTSISYDSGNRVTGVTDSLAGTVSRSYDGLDRITQEATPQGTVSYAYDAAGRRTAMTVAGQPSVSYSYDNADRLAQIAQGTSTVGFAYDAANRRSSLTLPNGIVVESAYDTASRLTGLTYKLGASVLGTLSYAYDSAGGRTQLGGTWARTGLPSAIGSASYDAANQQLVLGGSTMSYDANGNLATLTDASGLTTFTWDARNRLTGLAGPGTTASFGYDGLGRRWTKTINGARTDFLYDRLNPVQELSGGSVLANILTGLGIDEYFARTDASGPRNLLTDALGSTVALTDESGTVATEYTYEPFGETTATGAPSTNPFQFTGRENDGTGLFYLRGRYHHPGLARFISEDPRVSRTASCFGWPASLRILGSDALEGMSQYAYARNNPVLLFDLDGNEAMPWRETRCPDCPNVPPCRLVRSWIVIGNIPDDQPDRFGHTPPKWVVKGVRRACTYRCPGGSSESPEYTVYLRCRYWHNT